MSSLDLYIILAYLLIIFIIAIIIGRKSNLDSYLVAGRHIKSIFLIFTVVSTMVGLSTTISSASAVYSSGISFVVISFFMIFLGYLLIFFFAKKIKQFGDKYKAHTIGDYFQYRYSKRVRIIGSISIMLSYFLFFSGFLLALSQLFNIFGGQGLFLSLIFALVGTLIYTVISGVKSDFYTDIIHFIVMFVTLIFIFIPKLIQKSGGISSLFSNLPAGYLNVFNFAGVPFFIFGILFGFPLFLLYMEIWQRIFSADSQKVVNKTIIWSLILTIPFLILSILIGLYGISNLPGINPDTVYFEVIKQIMPVGLLGVMIAGVIAALLSTLNTIIMVISACFTKDIYLSFFKSSSEKKTLFIARITTLLVGVIGITIAYFFQNLVELAVAANEGLLVLAPPIIGGFLWKRATEKGAFYSMLFGLISLWGFYPFIGKMSFIPAIIICTIIFIFFSKKK